MALKAFIQVRFRASDPLAPARDNGMKPRISSTERQSAALVSDSIPDLRLRDKAGIVVNQTGILWEMQEPCWKKIANPSCPRRVIFG